MKKTKALLYKTRKSAAMAIGLGAAQLEGFRRSQIEGFRRKHLAVMRIY